MPVTYPTVDEVREAFADSVPPGAPFDNQRWLRLERAVLSPAWQPLGGGVEVLQVNGARLVKVRWRFEIDKMNISSEAELRSVAAALQQQLLVLLNDEPASFDVPKSEIKKGPITIVYCWTNGIIG